MLWHWGDLVASGEELPGQSACLASDDPKSLDWQQRRDGHALNGMTINVALVTSEALVLGCDSTASITRRYLDPFGPALRRNAGGVPAIDKQGRFTIRFTRDDLEEIVTDAWGGVTKMFELCGQPCHVAGVTAGTATLNDRPIALIAADFYEVESNKTPMPTTVKEVADDFLVHMRQEYDLHYTGTPLPTDFREGPEFLVGGYGINDRFASLYRVLVKENTVEEEFAAGRFGVAWNAQSDAVERLIRGYDAQVAATIETEVNDAMQQYADKTNRAVLRIVGNILKKAGVPMPTGVNMRLPAPTSPSLSWNKNRMRIGYPNFPTQEAINFVGYLINAQSGRAKFSRGVGTVGGFHHVGVVTKKGYEAIKEPELKHPFTGFEP